MMLQEETIEENVIAVLAARAEKAKPKEDFIKFDIYFETVLLFLMSWYSFSFLKK